MQFSPFHFLIFLLNSIIGCEHFIEFGRLFQKMLPLKAKESVPQAAVFASGSINSEPDIRLYI